MVLVDTSVWVAHLRAGVPKLTTLLNDGAVACHLFIIGELACGNIRNRKEILSLLRTLPSAQAATHEEALLFIENRSLMGRGLGYIDVHLLASATLTGMPIWTFDQKLSHAAVDLKIHYRP
ncbi:MAG: type II toxin-antitoxin system VapC family toxin [bacterium]